MVTCGNCGEENPERARFCLSCGSALPSPWAHEVRKTVTVVFSDLVGSTPLGEHLDPESLREVMNRYYERTAAVLSRHGGTVAKFIGDAVMAIFGIPQLHDEDALRAVRAAAELRGALTELNVELEAAWGVRLVLRTGVNTGEVVMGAAFQGQDVAVGDAVNVAARLEQAAGPDEILLGEATWRLVRDAITAEPVAPLAFKGKSEPVAAWRLLSVSPDAPGHARRLDGPMIGRDRERALLIQAFERAAAEHACHLFTVLGSAGVGKSRLVREFLVGIHDRATVLHGRCLDYGDGITFWPIAEVVRDAAGAAATDPPTAVQAKLHALLRGEEHAERIAERAGGLLGGADAAPVEELRWAVRELLQALARRRPLVIVLEDLHWAEPTLLDIVEHIAERARDVPLLLCGIARLELLDRRPGWGGGKPNATSILLEPLSAADSARLVDGLLGGANLEPQTKRRIADAAEGNPLFAEELVAMLIEQGMLVRFGDQWIATTDLASIPVPASISALLAARIEQLEAGERVVIERASVVGDVFSREAVAELSPEPIHAVIGEHLDALVRKELIGPDRSRFAGGETFRFRHALIRDAAYAMLPKRDRAELHERFAGWLERVVGERRGEDEEIVGYHLEQAYHFRAELGPVDEPARTLASGAAERLSATGRRAFERGDTPAAVNLLRRVTALLPATDPARYTILPGLGVALFQAGKLDEADTVLAEAEAGMAAGAKQAAWQARIERLWLQMLTHPEQVTLERARQEAEQAIAVLSKLGDDTGLAKAWRLLSEVNDYRCHLAEAAETAELAVTHARRAGNAREEGMALAFLALALDCGPTPVAEAIDRCETLLADVEHRRWQIGMSGPLAHLQAKQGRLAEARMLIRHNRAIAEELGLRWLPWLAWWSGNIELLADDPATAEQELRLGYAMYQRMGEKNLLSTLAVDLAEALHAQGQHDEALQFTKISQATASREDLWSQAIWRTTRSKVLAGRGHIDEAERLAHEAVHLAAETDFLDMHADALLALAHVRQLTDHRGEARRLLSDAIRLYMRKGNLTSAMHAQTLLGQFESV